MDAEDEQGRLPLPAACVVAAPAVSSFLNQLRAAISGSAHKPEPHHRDTESQGNSKHWENLGSCRFEGFLCDSVSLWWVLLGTGDRSRFRTASPVLKT